MAGPVIGTTTPMLTGARGPRMTTALVETSVAPLAVVVVATIG
jgi:hypothetical protein